MQMCRRYGNGYDSQGRKDEDVEQRRWNLATELSNLLTIHIHFSEDEPVNN